MTSAGYRLGVDFGTSNTVAMLQWPDGQVRSLLFDGSPLLPSSVYADPNAGLLVGRDAAHAARAMPERFEPNPKRRIDEPTVLLGDAEIPINDLIASVLRRVAAEAQRVTGGPVPTVALTHPAAWGQTRRGILIAAAERAGLGRPTLIPEPIAAASSFVEKSRSGVSPGEAVVVYDLGAGTFDASVVRREPNRFEVVADEGLSQAGGLDIDAAIVAYLGAVYGARHPDLWKRLTYPTTPADRRAKRLLWEDVRTAKEMLSRAPSTTIHVPLADQDAPLGRDQFEQLARPVLDSTVVSTRAAISTAGISPDKVAAIFLVGGGSRIPLAATLLHQAFRIAPTVIEQPELAVAEGGLRALGPANASWQAAAASGAPPHGLTQAPYGAGAPVPPAGVATVSSLGPPPPQSPPSPAFAPANWTAPTPPTPRPRRSTAQRTLLIGLPVLLVLGLGGAALATMLGPEEADRKAPSVDWTTDASKYAGKKGLTIEYDCPPDGTAETAWGTDVYTADSSVCTAAVHARKIPLERGGKVIIEMRPGEDSYRGSNQNGVTTINYNSFEASFVFPS
ncbi:MAG: Hsp70 family protein [Micromonosporaceae bacterium]